MKINTSHLVGAAIALAAVFFSKLDAQDARPDHRIPEWEYKVSVQDWPIEPLQVALDGAGEMGWELVGFTSVGNQWKLIYKRPKGGMGPNQFYKRPVQ